MYLGKCEIGTYASEFNSNSELEDQNVVKVSVQEKLKPGKFVDALDFVRTSPKKDYENYHHIGIYAFTNKALLNYVSLKDQNLKLKEN